MRAHPAGPRHGDVIAAPSLPVSAPATASAAFLDAAIWPSTLARTADGALAIGGCDVRELAAEHGTPAFLLDKADFTSRARAFKEAYEDEEIPGRVYYAGKSFLSATTIRWIESEGLNLDVCSGGELALALRTGFPAQRLAFHGNNKSTAELVQAVDAGIGSFVIDSMGEIARLASIAAERGVRPKVYLRITVGVEAHTHEFIATAHEDQKFGLSLASGAAMEAVSAVLQSDSLELIGLHSHIGSQIFDTAGFEVAARRVVRFLAAIRDAHGIELPVLNLGGGMGIAYVAGDTPVTPADMAASLRGIVRRECEEAGLALPTLAVEPGRAIVGPSMITIYEVGTVKPVQVSDTQKRLYVSVDGGMSDNIRTALYDAEYTITLANRVSEADLALSRVVGKHCESGDVVIRDVWLPSDIAAGDLLAVAATGAYCRAMASNYNLIPRPPVIAVAEGDSTTVLRRETVEDLLALDAGL